MSVLESLASVLWEEGHWTLDTMGVKRVGSELPFWAAQWEGARRHPLRHQLSWKAREQGLGTKKHQPVQTGRQPDHQ